VHDYLGDQRDSVVSDTMECLMESLINHY